PGAAPTTTQIIDLDALWRYRDVASAPPADWATISYDDSAWGDGPGLLYAGSSSPTGAGEGLIGYWPLEETSGSSAPNSVVGGQAAQLFNGAAWFADATRGQVLVFNGVDAYADAGSIPQQTLGSVFTWSFWAYASEAASNNVMLGNRYSPGGGEFTPREFIKFTTNQLEFHRNGAGENVDYVTIPENVWVHHAAVKDGATLTYFRDGVSAGTQTITQGLNNAQPFYFGGDQGNENWTGRLDEPAVWARALPASSIAAMANGSHTPLTAPTIDNGSSGLLQTELVLGANAYYFRHSFAYVGDPARTVLTLQLMVDDGAVVYLNGVEVHRENMPSGTINYTSLASTEIADPSLSAGFIIPASALVQGTNVFAVEIHQASPADPDMAFGATLVSTELPPPPATFTRDVVFNEITEATNAVFQIELINLGSSAVELGGYIVQSSSGASYTLPSGLLASGEQRAISAATLGFTPVSGERLLFFRSGGAELADAREVTNRLRGLSGGQWLYPSAPSFGAPNIFNLNRDMVINEIMYNPRPMQAPYAKSDAQWIELYNRGAASVDLGGWTFTDGIAYTFPSPTILGAGEYLVVARNAAVLVTNLPGVRVLGDWEGSLSRSGERLVLRDANKNIADQVRFADGGRWDSRADGGGASLELIDPDADNNTAESWLASDEGARSSWQSYSYRASGANHGNDPTQYNEFIFGLLDNGELLIDDISVVEDPDGAARELIQNGNFSSGAATSWRLLGTHRHAAVMDDPESPGNKVLHLTSSGSTEHMHNHVETTLKAGGSFVTINGGLDYTISYRARFLSGSNQLHTRLYFNRAARTTLLEVPDGGGSPGGENTRRVLNAGPTFAALCHNPAVPDVGEAILVTVSAVDSDDVAGITLFYSVNGSAFVGTPMTGQEGDQYLGTIPGQAASDKIQFYLEATDGLGAQSLFPAGGPTSRAIIPVEDGQADLDYGDCQPNNLRIVMTNEDRDFMHTVTEVMSNDRLGCTVIWNEREIYYDCGVRLKGSQRGRHKDVRVGFSLKFPADQPFLGAHGTIAVDRSGAGDQFSQKEIMVKHAINHAGGGIPGMEDDLIRVIAPKSQHTSSAMLLKSRYDDEWLENMYAKGADGTAWEYELIYYPTTTTGGVEGYKLPTADIVRGVGTGSLGTDPELYRWHWLIESNLDEDNYAPLMEFLQAYGQPSSAPSYHEDMRRLLDIDQWLRAFAVQVLFGIGDNYSSGSQHNAIFYQRPADGKFLYLPWDMDFTFAAGATSDLTPNGELDKLMTAPANERAYWGHIEDIVSTTCNISYMAPWAEHYSCFLPNENLSGFMNYIQTRSAHALSGVNSAIPHVAFGVTTSDPSTSGTLIAIEGDGWVDVRALRLAGNPNPLMVEWTDNDSWQVILPVTPGTNTYVVEAYDFQENFISSDTISITGTGSVLPAAAGNLAISEIMYHPGDVSSGEITAGFADEDLFEFVELMNIASAAVSLDGARFSGGINHPLPPAVLAPGQRRVLARNRDAFLHRHPAAAGVLLDGAYVGFGDTNQFSNSGEEILLVDAAGVDIRRFTYDQDLPWPPSADGDGFSLVLVAPECDPDHALAANWRSSGSTNGTPGTSEASLFVGDPNADDDGDGISNYVDYALGDTAIPALVSGPGSRYLFTFQRNLRAEDVVLAVESSPDLITWGSAGLTWESAFSMGGGLETQTWSLDTAAGKRLYVRLVVRGAK
ncbi:MAG: hypothetical protein ACI9TH_002778, partial [Kiritimatiellia bacterium]